jgi:uncharacterized protein GlcG (DUF336 family)
MRKLCVFISLAVSLGCSPVTASDVISSKQMSLELARDLASGAVEACRKQGYQVSAVVVDRHGTPQVLMRDVYASRFTIQIAEEKANAVVLSGIDSSEFRKNRQDIRPEMNHVRGILMLEGAVAVRAGGALLGAVGVSGAPGGDRDEACARESVKAVQDRLDFAD